MITIDTREFESALRQYKDASGKDNVEVVNHAAKNLVGRAMQFTPKADRAKIAAALERTVSWNGRSVPLKYLLVNSRRRGGPGLAGKEMARAARKFVAKRKASAGYVRAGWFKAAEAFGLRAGKVNPRGLAAQGSGKPATLHQLAAELINAARAAVPIAGPALEKAVDFVANDLKQYAERKRAETARKYSAR